MEFNCTHAKDKLDLLNEILTCKFNSSEFINYENVLKKLTDLVDRLGNDKKSEANSLLSIENGNDTTVMLIVKDEAKSTAYPYTLYTWTRKESIERPLNFVIHEETYSNKLEKLISAAENNTPLQGKEIVSLLLTENLTGYSLNINKIKEYIEFSKSSKNQKIISKSECNDIQNELLELRDKIVDSNTYIKTKITNKIKKFADNLKCDNLNLVISDGGLDHREIVIGKIVDVRQVGNTRHYKVEYINTRNSNILAGTAVYHTTPGTYGSLSVNKLGEIYISESRRRYSYSSPEPDAIHVDSIGSLPYNYIDNGRYLVMIKRSLSTSKTKIIISGDPRVDENYKETLLDVISRYQKHTINNDIVLEQSNIEDKNVNYYQSGFISRIKATLSTAEIKEKALKLELEALKKMVNEYKYLEKKHKSIGKDVFITDKIKYNHNEGKVSYGDFSIGVDDELMKSKLYESFESYLVKFYRGETTEENILNGLLDRFFYQLNGRLHQVKSDEDVELVLNINNCIDVNIKASRTKSNSTLLYLNNKRFNKNEIILVLKEITCYRDANEANRFIQNIGKLGLSVYIGITTGFQINLDDTENIYRFKNKDKRSEYKLILDDLEIDIKGKKLISLLYKEFIGEGIGNLKTKLDKTIFNSVNNSLDYLKYKFLIDSSYEAFKEKSRKFLDKKVKDVEGEYCMYLPERKKKALEAIRVTGLSGNKYIVAFDSKESYVFLHAEKKEENDYWSNGKYICMVDQSNIKSNIGYDTVVSKLMALRNDSLIAGTIYNLEEELENE